MWERVKEGECGANTVYTCINAKMRPAETSRNGGRDKGE
jgi:hypothetical protein